MIEERANNEPAETNENGVSAQVFEFLNASGEPTGLTIRLADYGDPVEVWSVLRVLGFVNIGMDIVAEGGPGVEPKISIFKHNGDLAFTMKLKSEIKSNDYVHCDW